MNAVKCDAMASAAPLGAVLDALLTADDAEFSRTVGSDAPDATTPTAAALASLSSSALTPLLDYSVGKKPGGRRHGRAASLVRYLLAHPTHGADTCAALAACLDGDDGRASFAAACSAACSRGRARAGRRRRRAAWRALCRCATTRRRRRLMVAAAGAVRAVDELLRCRDDAAAADGGSRAAGGSRLRLARLLVPLASAARPAALRRGGGQLAATFGRRRGRGVGRR